jgi:hypothetical protein
VIVNLLEPGFPKTGGFYKSEFVEKIDKKECWSIKFFQEKWLLIRFLVLSKIFLL